MEKRSQVTLDVMEMLRQTGLDPNKFMLWNEHESENKILTNQVNVQPSQKR
ncbi:hypothetical protein SAMN04487897_102519 [Paenibacillus sp. yr247]|nr:hypothetical protein SAMN04487897_102519 [Paenibacillus sp. yr247]